MASEALEKALQDIDLKRHRRNPFDARYLKLCLSDFAEVALMSQRPWPHVYTHQDALHFGCYDQAQEPLRTGISRHRPCARGERRMQPACTH